MRRLLPLLFLLGACDRCQRSEVRADAGESQQGTSVDAGRAAVDATDLRSAMLLALPEFSYTAITEAQATFERISKPTGKADTKPLDFAEKWFADQGWKIESRTEKSLAATQRPFQVLTHSEPDHVLQAMRIQLGESGVKSLFGAPQSQTTETLTQRFAPLPGYTTVEQTFGFHVEFAASPGRAAFLTMKQVQNLVAAGWEMTSGPTEILHPDGGHETLPETMNITLDQRSTGARLKIVRSAKIVTVDLEQPIKVR